MRSLAIVFLVLLQVAGFANSLTLYNNSPFTLTATVIGSDGTTLGQFTIKPQNAAQWTDEFEQPSNPSNPVVSQSPYTVIWYCPEGTEYGISSDQAAGAYILAASAQGSLGCKVKQQPLLQPQMPQQ